MVDFVHDVKQDFGSSVNVKHVKECKTSTVRNHLYCWYTVKVFVYLYKYVCISNLTFQTCYSIKKMTYNS